MLELDDIAQVIATAVKEATAPLTKRIAELEARAPFDPAELVERIGGMERQLELPAPDFDVLVSEHVAKAVADIQLPEPAPAAEVDMDAVQSMITEAVSTIPVPDNGKDCDMDAVKAFVSEQVTKAVDAIPVPKDGVGLSDAFKDEDGNLVLVMADGRTKSLGLVDSHNDAAPDVDAFDMDAVKAHIEQLVGAIPVAKDGVGLADAIIDADGQLVLTMTDGRVKTLSRVVGKDAPPPVPFTLDDFDIEPTGERTIELKFTHGGVCHTFELEFPVPIYRGVFSEKEAYAKGDLVTWGGSMWHCDEAKGLKPDSPESGWRLAVKRGRDGK